MAKAVKVEPREAMIAIVGFLSLANYASVRFLEYPFLYCWTHFWLRPLYYDWAMMVVSISFIYGALFLLVGNHLKAAIGFGVFFAVINLPKLADTVFRMGGSCG